MRLDSLVPRATGAGAILALVLLAGIAAGPALADNQTPTVSPVSTDTSALPYTVQIRQVDTERLLPTLQSYAYGQIDGLWVLIGGRTSGLHKFTNNPIKNFPPRRQNDRIWVINPETGQRWSRSLADSALSEDQVDALSTTAAQGLQVGETLYVVGGYGYSRSAQNFMTYDTLTAFDLRTVVSWVRKDSNVPDLAHIIRQTSHKVLKVTGGQMTRIGNRTMLVFGQLFDGGYGGPTPPNQIYTTQVRSFRLIDNGRTVRIARVRRDPVKPNPTDYRRRDYTLIPTMEVQNGRRVEKVTALAGVFTLTDGMFTVPVEVDGEGRPSMADPAAKATFKQAMNGYDCAFLPIWDSRRKQSHALLFGGISFVEYDPDTDRFVEDNEFPFINDVTAIVRTNKGRYRQVLVGSYPEIDSKDGKRLRFGAEAHVLIDPNVPTMSNGMINLTALKRRFGTQPVVVGRIFGGIAADAGNNGNTTASNLMFEVVLTPR